LFLAANVRAVDDPVRRLGSLWKASLFCAARFGANDVG
jgi:hypothetical protein